MRHVAWVTLAAVVLGCVWLIWPQREAGLPQVMDAWPPLDEGQVGAVEFDWGAGVLRLERRDGGWYGKGEAGWTRANEPALQRLLQEVAGMRQMRVVTHAARMHAALGVASGLRLRILDIMEEPLLDLYIGRGGVNLLSTYVRKADEDVVYAVDRLLGPLLPRSLAYWLPPDAVAEPDMPARPGGED